MIEVSKNIGLNDSPVVYHGPATHDVAVHFIARTNRKALIVLEAVSVHGTIDHVVTHKEGADIYVSFPDSDALDRVTATL